MMPRLPKKNEYHIHEIDLHQLYAILQQMTGTAEKIKTDTSDRIVYTEPSKYKVIFLNDDKTPMDFVVEVLTQIFNKSPDEATQIMNKIHVEGSGVVGVYSYEIAESKAIETTGVARQQGFPLQVKVEEDK